MKQHIQSVLLLLLSIQGFCLIASESALSGGQKNALQQNNAARPLPRGSNRENKAVPSASALQLRHSLRAGDVNLFVEALAEYFQETDKYEWPVLLALVFKSIRVASSGPLVSLGSISKSKVKIVADKLLQKLADKVIQPSHSRHKALALRLVDCLDQDENLIFRNEVPEMQALFVQLCAFNNETVERPNQIRIYVPPAVLDDSGDSDKQREEEKAKREAQKEETQKTLEALQDKVGSTKLSSSVKQTDEEELTVQQRDALRKKNEDEAELHKSRVKEAQREREEAERKRLADEKARLEAEAKQREEELLRKQEEEKKQNKKASRKNFDATKQVFVQPENAPVPAPKQISPPKRKVNALAGSLGASAQLPKNEPKPAPKKLVENDAGALKVAKIKTIFEQPKRDKRPKPEIPAQNDTKQDEQRAGVDQNAQKANEAQKVQEESPRAQSDQDETNGLASPKEPVLEQPQANNGIGHDSGNDIKPPKEKRKKRERKKAGEEEVKAPAPVPSPVVEQSSKSSMLKKMSAILLISGTALGLVWLASHIKDKWDNIKRLATFNKEKLESNALTDAEESREQTWKNESDPEYTNGDQGENTVEVA